MANVVPGAALEQIRHLFAAGTVAGLSDAQLLDRFRAGRDTSAFEALVTRHGPMVLAVCRGVLRDPHDAEDAFQATFLVLVRKAGTIRGCDALGGWLHKVAHRVAREANAASARRRAHEREAGRMAAASSSSGSATRDERLSALHEEIARLPEKHRLPVVLCELEGIPQAQAAWQLRWSERTLRRRLAEGRQRLKGRLDRRGLGTAGAMIGPLLAPEARAVVPAAWLEAAARGAMNVADRAATAGAVTAAGTLSREVLRTMMLQKLKLASAALLGTVLLTWGGTTALLALGEESPHMTTTPPPAGRRTARTALPRPEPDPLDVVGKLPVRGRVLDPDGKPVANAEIFVLHRVYSWLPDNPVTAGQKSRVALSDADGRFRFELDKALSDWPYGDDPPWQKAQVAASAPGMGLAWVEAGSLAGGGEATLRLVRDDVPIRGRVLDTQGHPIAGVFVRLDRVGVVGEGVDLDAMLASGEVDDAQASAWYGYVDGVWPGGQNTSSTDADGRFEVKGVGRDRLAMLAFHGPSLATGRLYAMARPARTPPKPRPRPNRRPAYMAFNGSYGLPPGPRLVGATFEHVADLTKPITGVVRLKGTGKTLSGVLVIGHEAGTMTQVSTRTDAEGRFRLVGLPKGELYQLRAAPRPGIDPFLGATITTTDTQGLQPIETALELPRGVIVTGRLVDEATGRLVWASQVHTIKLPTNLNEGNDSSGAWSLTDPTFRLTTPPGEALFYAAVRGRETPYTRARLSKADRGKGVGGDGDGETITTKLNAYHTCKIFNVPDTTAPFPIELKLTRGLSRRGRVVGPDGKPVMGAQCYGLISTWGGIRSLADDTFEVLGLETDQPRQLIFAHEDRGLVGSVVFKGDDAKDESPFEVRLVPAGSVNGRLLDENGLPLSDAKLWVMSYDLNGGNLPPGRLWPDGSTFMQPNGWLFSTDADGRFRVVGLKPGIKSSIGVDKKTRPNYQLDTRGVLRDIVLQHPGEVRDLGDVTVKESPIR